MLKRIFVSGLFLLISILVALYFFGGPLLSPYAKKAVDEKLQTLDFAKCQIGDLQIHQLWPLKILVSNLECSQTAGPVPVSASVRVEKINLDMQTTSFIPTQFTDWNVKLSVSKPQIDVKMITQDSSKEVVAPKVVTPTGAPSNIPPFLIHLQLEIESGFLKVIKDAKDFLALPFQLKSQEIVVKPDFLTTESLLLDISGLVINLFGASNLTADEHNWKAKIDLEDLSALKVPPDFLPPGQWSGGFVGDAVITKKGSVLEASANLETKKLQGHIDHQTPELSAKGAVAPELKAQVTYKGDPAVLTFDELRVDADLSDLSLEIPNQLKKAAAVPLLIKLQAKGPSDRLQIEKMQAQLSQLILTAQGAVALKPGGNSDLKVQMPSASLAGLENIIIPLGGTPVSGVAGFEASFNGDLFDLNKSTIDFPKLQLQDVRGSLNFVSQDQTTKLKGPIHANFNGTAQIRNLALTKAQGAGQIDLSGLSVDKKDTFQKKSNEPLFVSLDAAQAGTQTTIKNFNVRTSFADLSLQGKITDALKPQLDLSAKINRLDLTKMSQQVHALRDMGLNGSATGAMKLRGELDTNAGIEKSNLTATGQVSLALAKYILKSAPAATAPTVAVNTEVAEPTSLLPDWPIMRSSVLEFSLSLGQFQMENLRADSIALKGLYNRGMVKAAGKIGKVFSGQMEFVSLEAKNLLKTPGFSGLLRIQNISVMDVTQYLVPEYVQYLKGGLMAGQFSFTSPMPQGPEWLNKVAASGNMRGTNIQTKEDVIQKALGDKLTKLAQDKKALSQTPKALSANLTTEFSLKNGVATVKALQLLTDDDNEFNGSGTVDLKLMGDLKGTLALSKVNVGGAVRQANSDAKGRLIVPLAIKGPLMQPTFDIAQSTLEEMTKRTLKFETKKATDDLKDKFKKEGKQKAKETLKKLFK